MPAEDHTPPQDSGSPPALPTDVAEEAARLTRLALDAADRDPDPGPYHDSDDDATPGEAALYRRRRDELLDRYDYVARVRDDRDGGATLVCHPAEWLDDDGTVRLENDLDTSRAAEISLSGPGEQGDFESAAATNDAVVEAVRGTHGDRHAANVRAFANFMANYYARPVDSATAAEVREFLEDYYPRNAWPTEAEASVVEDSLRYAFDLRETRYPLD